jgi:hypothetical protein
MTSAGPPSEQIINATMVVKVIFAAISLKPWKTWTDSCDVTGLRQSVKNAWKWMLGRQVVTEVARDRVQWQPLLPGAAGTRSYAARELVKLQQRAAH